MAPPYTIRSAGPADLPLLHAWRSKPHVARWWGVPELESDFDELLEGRVGMWIAEFEKRPFGFLQDYRVSHWPPHHFDFLPPASRGLDMFIGESDMIGMGHGSRLLRQHSDALIGLGAPALGIDPHPDNKPAIRAFEKAGFAIIGGSVETRWGLALLMVRQA